MKRYREQANLLKIIAHPVRLEILEALCAEDECVCHLSAATGKPQPYVSQQLAIMRNAGLILDRKDGNNVYYGLAEGAPGAQIMATLVGLAGEAAGAAQMRRKVAKCPCPKCNSGG